MHPVLAAFITDDVSPAAVALRACEPSPEMWLLRLQQCAVRFGTDGQLALLAAGLREAEAQGLRVLNVGDMRPLPARRAAPARLPALADLPHLHTLVSWGAVHALLAGRAQAVWQLHRHNALTPAAPLPAGMHPLPAGGSLALPPPHHAPVHGWQLAAR